MTLAELLYSFAQGASNSIASNVSAPVDGISWALRKAGVPIPSNPMGGSDWMAQRGLMREPQNRLAGLLGETAGMIGPMLVAEKAPQIAGGLLNMADNAIAPRTLNRQAGAVRLPEMSDAERAAKMAEMGMERGWYRGGPAIADAKRSGPWYTQDAEEAANYAKRFGEKSDVREYSIPDKGFIKGDGGYPSRLAHDVAGILDTPTYGKEGGQLVKELRSYGPNEPVAGGAIWQALESRFGNDGAAEVLQRLGFKGAKGITGGPEAYVFNGAPVRDANKAAFNSANAAQDNLYGKASLPTLGLLGGTALGANYLLRRD